MSTFINGTIVNTEAKKSAQGNSMVVFSVSIDPDKKPRKVFVVKNEKFTDRINKMLGTAHDKVEDIVKEVKAKTLIGTSVSCLMVEDTFINEEKESITYQKLAIFYPKYKADNLKAEDMTPVDDGDMPF